MTARQLFPALVPGLIALSLLPAGAATDANVVAEQVKPIPRSGSPNDPPILLVYVVDQDAVPLEGAQIELIGLSKANARVKTGKDGTALLKMQGDARLTVRASLADYVPSEARGVVVARNGLTSVALALAAEPTP